MKKLTSFILCISLCSGMQHELEEQNAQQIPAIAELLVLDKQIEYLLKQFGHFPNYTSPVDEKYFILNAQQLQAFLKKYPRLEECTIAKMVSENKEAAQNLFNDLHPSLEIPPDNQTLISSLETALYRAIGQRETEVERHHAMLTCLNNRRSKSKK